MAHRTHARFPQCALAAETLRPPFDATRRPADCRWALNATDSLRLAGRWRILKAMGFEAGERVGGYELVEPLGVGGQGSVWKVIDSVDREAWRALKLVDTTEVGAATSSGCVARRACWSA